MHRADPWRWVALAAAIACASVALFPLYWIAMTSLLPTSAILSRDPPLLPPPGLLDASAYQGVLLRKPLLRWIGNSMAVTLGTLALTMTAAALAGYSLSRFRTAAQRAMGFALLASKMMPAALVVIPFFVLTLLAALQSIPAALHEAAQVDGASATQRFRHVTWPGIRGAAMLAIVLQALWVVKDFDLVFATTGGGPSRATQTLSLLVYEEAFQFFRFGQAAAIGVLLLVACAALSWLSMRRDDHATR